MRQALFECETPRLKLKSSRSFLAIKRWQRTKSKKVIKHLRSSKLRWCHIWHHSCIPVNIIDSANNIVSYVRMPKTSSDRSFQNSKEWLDVAIKVAGKKHRGTYEAA
jgi:hypothetical protein